jgi:cytochrome P450
MLGAIEELLRLHSITDLTVPKLAAEDIEIAGCPVRRGEGLLPLTGAANHDPQVFPQPREFNPQRARRDHLAFGSGAHMCLGQSLARAEMETVFSTMLRRVPSLSLAVPVSELDLDRDAVVWGVKALPVAW